MRQYNIDMTNNYDDTTGRRVRWLRERRGLTQIELASALQRHGVDVGNAFISQIEKQNKPASVKTIAALSAELGTTIDYLLMATDDPAPPTSSLNQIVVDVTDADERVLIEEWIDLIQDMSPEQRRSLLQSVRLLLTPYNPPRIIGG